MLDEDTKKNKKRVRFAPFKMFGLFNRIKKRCIFPKLENSRIHLQFTVVINREFNVNEIEMFEILQRV